MNFIYVFLGSGLGGGLRFLLSRFDQKSILLILSVNLLGSLLLGYVGSKYESAFFWTIGFCGGFTTFSTFAGHGYTLIEEGKWGTFLILNFTAVTLGPLFFMIGKRVSKIF